MDHPIINNRITLSVYFVFWMLVAVLHALFLYQFFGASGLTASMDGLLFSLMYSVIALGLWYMVKFSQVERSGNYQLVINHLTGVAFTIFVWLLLGYFSMRSIPFVNADYPVFFMDTLVWRVLFGVVIYLLIVLVYYVVMYYSNFQEKIIREADLKTAITNSELNLLKAHVNPHFLFNSLNSVSALTTRDPAKARMMITKLSDFLRSSINMKEGNRTLREELAHISDYLDIEKVRFGERLSVELNISKKGMDARVPNLIFQPLVENVIKHGVAESTEKVRLHIVADCFHGFLKVQVRNNYDPEFRSRNGHGIGLESVRKRMKLTYGREDLVAVINENSTFNVTMNFPQEL